MHFQAVMSEVYEVYILYTASAIDINGNSIVDCVSFEKKLKLIYLYSLEFYY